MELSRTPFTGAKETSIFGLPTLYYLPKQIEIFGRTEDTEPTLSEMMTMYFIRDNERVYGYYTGLKSINNIHGTTQVPATIRIKSNAVKEEQKYNRGCIKYIINPTTIQVNSDNYIYLELLDDIEFYYDYFEEDVVDCIKYVVERMSLSIDGFKSLLKQYSDRTRQVIKDVYTK